MIIKKLDNAGSLIKPPLSENLKSGLVILQKGEEVGEHITEKREEIIIILKGKAWVSIENELETVEEGSLIYIPEGKRHNLVNKDNKALEYVYLVSFL